MNTQPEKLITMQLALTYRCQCTCPHCSASAFHNQDSPELSRAEVTTLLEQCRDNDIDAVYFFGGEPMLSPDLLFHVRTAARLGLICKFDTNGILLTPEHINEFQAAGIESIGISLDSALEETHDRLRGVPGAFRRALAALVHCRRIGLDRLISTYVTKETLRSGELQLMIALADRLDTKLRILTPYACGNWDARDDIALNTEEIHLLRSSLRPGKVFWERKDIDSPTTPFRCSYMDRKFFYISSFGDVYPCGFVPKKIGSVRTEPLASILERLWSRTQHTTTTYDHCPFHMNRVHETVATMEHA